MTDPVASSLSAVGNAAATDRASSGPLQLCDHLSPRCLIASAGSAGYRKRHHARNAEVLQQL